MPTWIGDLHCHSVHSDGSATTEQIIEFARRLGLTHIALTDHDTMDGVATITRQGAAVGISVIPGVECSCVDPASERSAHLLCYAPACPAELQAFLNPTLARRREAKLEMARKLQALYPIREEDVLRLSRHSASIHEPHLIQALADMGYTAAVFGDLMKRLIGKRGSCYVPVAYPDVWQTARAIREAGGVTVLAHPGQYGCVDLARELCESGLLNGIECYHPRNDAATTAACERLADRYALIRTGGSDFHGAYAWHPHPLGSYTADVAALTRLTQ